jgi:hypothetical protein
VVPAGSHRAASVHLDDPAAVGVADAGGAVARRRVVLYLEEFGDRRWLSRFSVPVSTDAMSTPRLVPGRSDTQARGEAGRQSHSAIATNAS